MKIMSGYITHLVLRWPSLHDAKMCASCVAPGQSAVTLVMRFPASHTICKSNTSSGDIIKIIIYIYSLLTITLPSLECVSMVWYMLYTTWSAAVPLSFHILCCNLYIYIVECRYNAVQYIIILHTRIQWQEQNINGIFQSQKTLHSSPSWVSYGVCCKNFQ